MFLLLSFFWIVFRIRYSLQQCFTLVSVLYLNNEMFINKWNMTPKFCVVPNHERPRRKRRQLLIRWKLDCMFYNHQNEYNEKKKKSCEAVFILHEVWRCDWYLHYLFIVAVITIGMFVNPCNFIYFDVWMERYWKIYTIY